MSEASDDNLKRLFAQAPVVGGDEHFVAAMAADVAARRGARRVRRVALLLLLSLAAVALAILLAPLAASIFDLGGSLLGLPDQVGAAAASAGRRPGALYIGIALAAIVVPLAGVAWLSRRT